MDYRTVVERRATTLQIVLQLREHLSKAGFQCSTTYRTFVERLATTFQIVPQLKEHKEFLNLRKPISHT